MLMGRIEFSETGAGYIEHLTPRGFREAQYPDGSRRVQAAYSWSRGSEGGITWRDLALVMVDKEGNEI